MVEQELCLSITYSLRDLRSYRDYVALCMGSDDIDCISPAAGAIIDDYIHDEYEALGMDIKEYLENNDSYSFFSKLKESYND